MFNCVLAEDPCICYTDADKMKNNPFVPFSPPNLVSVEGMYWKYQYILLRGNFTNDMHIRMPTNLRNSFIVTGFTPSFFIWKGNLLLPSASLENVSVPIMLRKSSKGVFTSSNSLLSNLLSGTEKCGKSDLFHCHILRFIFTLFEAGLLSTVDSSVLECFTPIVKVTCSSSSESSCSKHYVSISLSSSLGGR